MKLFTTLCLEITSDCNRKCEFCPVAYNTRPSEAMPFHVVEAACDELASLKYRGRVELYIYNEPLKQREPLYAALDAFKMRCPNVTVMIATNGDFLKGTDDIAFLFHKGVQQIVLNAYTAKQVPRFREWAAAFPDLTDDVYRPLPRGKCAIKVYDKSTPESFGTGIFRLQNRAGLIPAFLPPAPEPVKRMCVKPFRLLNVNWRGEALVCCNDYHGDVVAGRFPTMSLEEIWNGPVLNAYRRKLMNKDRSLPLCRVCDCHSGAYPHNVDRDIGLEDSESLIEGRYLTRVAARGGKP